jgi:superkiller protein 3
MIVLGGVTAALLIIQTQRSESTHEIIPALPPALSSAPEPGPAIPDIAGPAENLLQIKAEELKLAQHLVATFPQEDDALNLLGDVLYQHGDIRQAVAVWQQALARDPHRIILYQKLGMAAKEQGDPNGAIAHWRQALEVDPNSPNLRWDLAEICLDQGRHREAAALLEQECRITPGAVRNYFLLGQTYLQLEAYPQAIENYRQALEIDPSYYNAYYGLGNAYLRTQEREKAQAAMQRFQELKQQHDALPDKQVRIDEVPDARRRMAQHYVQAYHFYRKARQAQAGVVLLQRAIALDPDNAMNLERLGVHYYTLRQLPEALRSYERARTVDPNNPRHVLNCGKILAAQNQFSRAEAMYALAISRFPTQSQGYTELAELYLRAQRNGPRAWELVHQALRLETSARNYFLLAWAQDNRGDVPSALAAIDQAVALAPQNRNYQGLRDNLRQKLASISQEAGDR